MDQGRDEPFRTDAPVPRARITQAAFTGTALVLVFLGLILPDVTASLARLAAGPSAEARLPAGERVAELEAALGEARAANAGLADRVAALERRLHDADRTAASGAALPEPIAPPAELAAIAPGAAEGGAAPAAFGLAVAPADTVEEARRLWRDLVAMDNETLALYRPRLAPTGGDGAAYRIVIGPFPTRIAADLTCGRLRERSIDCTHAVFSGRPLTVD